MYSIVKVYFIVSFFFHVWFLMLIKKKKKNSNAKYLYIFVINYLLILFRTLLVFSIFLLTLSFVLF